MAETEGNKRYCQRFRLEWMKDITLKNWILEKQGRAFCRFCNCFLRTKYYDLKIHAATNKHKQSSLPFSQSRMITDCFQPKEDENLKLLKQKTEAGLCLFVLNHSAIQNVNHLSNMCKMLFSNAEHVKNVQLHRTKCSAIVKNIFFPYFKQSLREDIGNSPFSLLIDESTDISVSKYLGISIKYFSAKSRDIISTFLSLESLEKANAESIVAVLKNCLDKYDLNTKNMIGLGTDNASVMVGANNGVFKRLKEENSSLILIRCVCHSVQLATSAAAKILLPANLEFLISESFNWFSKSSLRQVQYQSIYSAINEGNIPLKLVHKCNTRWLSIEPCITRIINQWLELKTHFQLAATLDRCYTAELLYKEYCNEVNLAYLLFLKSILKDVLSVNKKFESNTANPIKLLNDLCFLIESLTQKITYPDCKIDLLNTIEITPFIYKSAYLGFEFECKINELKEKGALSVSEEKSIRENCIGFIKNLIMELKNRLPENVKVLRMISKFSIGNILNTQLCCEDLVPILKVFCDSYQEIDQAINQIKNLRLISWLEKSDDLKFWIEVKAYTDSSGFYVFKELAAIAIKLFILPWSNAEVERLFSQLSLLKTKHRNRLNLTTVNSILTTKYGLKRVKKCCNSFEFPPQVLKKIATNDTYQKDCSYNVDDFEIIVNDLHEDNL